MRCLCGRVHSQANKAQLLSISYRTTEHHCPIVPLPPVCYSPVLTSKHLPSSNIRLGCPCFVLQRTKHLWTTIAAKNTMLHCLDRKNKTYSYKYIPYIKSAYVGKLSKTCIKTALVVLYIYIYIYIYIADRASQYIYLNINQLDARNFIMSLSCLYMFRAHVLIVRRPWPYTYRCDDTRRCIVQIWPDDEHMCSKHIEAWNKLIIKFSASSWLILR